MIRAAAPSTKPIARMGEYFLLRPRHGVLEEKPRTVRRKTLKPEHQLCLFTRTHPAASATINESEEMEGGTPTLVFYDGLADRSHTRTTCEPRAEKRLHRRYPQPVVGDAHDLLIL